MLSDGSTRPLCGGWCCYKLDFTQFPVGLWNAYPCDYLTDGLCTCHTERTLTCSGFPFYDGSPSEYPANKFPVPWCVYRREVLDLLGISYTMLETGEQCIEAYKLEGLHDFERWMARRFFKERTVFFERW